MPEEKQQNGLLAPSDVFHIWLLIANVLGASFHPILRKRVGCDVPGIPGVLALLGMVIYVQHTHSDAMAIYVVIWLVMLVYMRITNDREQHSKYTGISRLQVLPPVRWLAWHKQERSARALEFLLLFIVGVLVRPLDEAMSNFCIAGSAGLAALEFTARFMMRRQDIAMNDARIMGGGM